MDAATPASLRPYENLPEGLLPNEFTYHVSDREAVTEHLRRRVQILDQATTQSAFHYLFHVQNAFSNLAKNPTPFLYFTEEPLIGIKVPIAALNLCEKFLERPRFDDDKVITYQSVEISQDQQWAVFLFQLRKHTLNQSPPLSEDPYLNHLAMILKVPDLTKSAQIVEVGDPSKIGLRVLEVDRELSELVIALTPPHPNRKIHLQSIEKNLEEDSRTFIFSLISDQIM